MPMRCPTFTRFRVAENGILIADANVPCNTCAQVPIVEIGIYRIVDWDVEHRLMMGIQLCALVIMC